MTEILHLEEHIGFKTMIKHNFGKGRIITVF